MKSIKIALKIFFLSFKVDFINSCIVLLMSILLGILPYLNTKGMLMIADLSNNSSLQLIIISIIFVISASLGTKLINSFNNVFINKLSTKLEFKLKKDLKEKCTKIDYRVREQSKFQQELRMAYNSINPFGLVKMNTFIPLLISTIITIVSLSFVLIKCNIIIWLFVLILTIITTILRNKVIKKNIDDDRDLIDERLLEETLLGNITNAESYAELRINNSVDWAISKWETQQDKLFNKELKINNRFQFKSEGLSFISHDFAFIASILILVFMSKLDITAIVVTFTAIQNLVNNFYIFSTELSITKNFLEMFNFYDNIFKYSDCELINKQEKLSSPKLQLSFKNVSFKYNEKYALENINFDVYEGEKIAIVGYNGSGKTTMLKLLLGLYSPCEGEIILNGCNSNERVSESVVFQDFAKYKLSIKENIYLYSSSLDQTDQNMISILQKYKLDNLLVYDANTILANEFGGINLSTGQWQKLAIIRSKLKEKYSIMIMDEATSALDSYTESELLNEILDEKNTLLYVCHRLVCVKSFDKIIFVDSGKISGIGNHDELFENNLKYREIYLSQAQDYIE